MPVFEIKKYKCVNLIHFINGCRNVVHRVSISFDLTKEEWINLKTNFSTSSWGSKNKIPNAFTERGLYMLATILKGRQAVQTTLCIIDTFVKLRELSKTMASIQNAEDGKTQKKLLQKGGEILSDIMGDNLDIAESETEFEINFAMIKLKHRITRKK